MFVVQIDVFLAPEAVLTTTNETALQLATRLGHVRYCLVEYLSHVYPMVYLVLVLSHLMETADAFIIVCVQHDIAGLLAN